MTVSDRRRARLDQGNREFQTASDRLLGGLEMLKERELAGPASAEEIRPLYDQLLNDLVETHRLLDRLSWDLELRDLLPVEEIRESINVATTTAVTAIAGRYGFVAPTVEQVRQVATEAGPALWHDQKARLISFHERAGSLRERVSANVDVVRTFLAAASTASDPSEIPNLDQHTVDIQVAVTSLYEELPVADTLLEDLDADTDLLGLPQTTLLRTTLIDVRETTVDVINALPGEHADHRWPRPPESGPDS